MYFKNKRFILEIAKDLLQRNLRDLSILIINKEELKTVTSVLILRNLKTKNK